MSDRVLPGTQAMSTLTVADVIRRVRSNVNELSAAFWSNTELMDWINDGCVDIATQALCLGAVHDVTLVAGTLEYELPTELRYAVDVAAVYNEAKGLEKGGPWRLGTGSSAKAGEPVEYYLFDGKVGIYPVPTDAASGAGKEVRVYFAEIPDPMTATSDLVPLPQIYNTALVHYVTAMALYKDVKEARGDRFLSLFDAVLKRYRVDFNEPERVD